MNAGGSLAEQVTNVLLLLPSLAFGSRLSNGATRQHAASVNTRYNDFDTDTQSNKEWLLSPADQSSSDNIDTSDKKPNSLGSMASGMVWDSVQQEGQFGPRLEEHIYDSAPQKPEGSGYIQSAHSSLLDWIGTFQASNQDDQQATEGTDRVRDKWSWSADADDSAGIGALSWLDDISHRPRQHSIGSAGDLDLSVLARSKRTAQAISTSSLSDPPRQAYPAESNQQQETFENQTRNITKAIANEISETLQNKFSINGDSEHGERHYKHGDLIQEGVDAASLTKSNSTLLSDGNFHLNKLIEINQSESTLYSSHSTSSVTSSYTESGITRFLDETVSDMSTQFPGFINLTNISLDGGNISGHYPGGIVDYYLGNATSDCFDWALNGTCLNDSLWNATNSSAMESSPLPPPIRLWALFLLIFPLFTVFGNSLVVLSVYKEKSLRTVTNYFIVSLAIADIMVAVLVMPLAVYVEVSEQLIYVTNKSQANV